MHDKVRFSEVSLCLGIIKNKSFDKCVRYLQGRVFKDKNLEVSCSPEKSVPSTHYVLSLDILYVPWSQSLDYFNLDKILFLLLDVIQSFHFFK